MKTILSILLFLVLMLGCKSYNNTQVVNNERDESLIISDTVNISSEESDYEIIIIEPGFNSWLAGTARSRGYYSQHWLESRNQLLVQSWNQRNLQPNRYDPNLYELRIDYDVRTDYGYEVNYLLYNYFVYFQLKYKQRLTSFIPRI